MSTYISFEDQRKQDASFTIKAMGIQLGINAATALVTMIGFSFLRPRNTLVYAPKLKFSKKEHQPPLVQSNGYFSWIKPILKVKDESLLEKIGCDALLYIRFVRLLRQLFFWMTIVGVCALIPIYVVATKYTGDWPPASGSIDTLSLSGINYVNGKTRTDLNTAWYWSPFAATYLYSFLIAYFMYRASCDYIAMRQHWFRLPQNEVSMKSLIISPVPKEMRSDEKLKTWVESTYGINYPIKETLIGHQSPRLNTLFEEHKEAVHRLESTLAAYLSDGRNTENKKRPLVRVGGLLCFGGRKVDAIEHYTEQVSDLEREIKELRQGKNKAKTAPYGWISFDRIEWAHATEQEMMHTQSHVRLSPTPQDLIWPNLPLDDKARKAKRWTGRIVYWVFVFAWMIPMTALSATSNLINLIRLIPNSSTFIEDHQIVMGIVQSYFTPIIMAVFFYLLPIFFRFLSKQQGYWTQTTLDRKVLVKLYIFFIINNLLVFTLTSIFVGIYGQVKALVENTDTSDSTDYIMQLAKNISQVANFWINYVCLHSLGLTMELAMILPLITITLRKFLTRPSPAELRELARPPEFDYPKNYNLLLFFFTVSLLYSAMSPLILPFAFLYFAVASMVYKYLLVYVYETRMESGGKIWPVLFQTILASTVLFQCIMILVLVFKGGNLQAYLLIPLPVLTVVYQYFYHRRMTALGSYLVGPGAAVHQSASLKSQFQDPAFSQKLAAPTVHEDVKHLLPNVYRSIRNEHHVHETIELAHQYSKRMKQEFDIDKKLNDVVVIHEGKMDVQFEAVTEEGITEVTEDEESAVAHDLSFAQDSFGQDPFAQDPFKSPSLPPQDSYDQNPFDQESLSRQISGDDRTPLLQPALPIPSDFIVYTSPPQDPTVVNMPSKRHTLPSRTHTVHDRRFSLPPSYIQSVEKPKLERSKSMFESRLHNPFDNPEYERRQSF